MKINRIVRVKIGKEGESGIEFTDLKMNFNVQKSESSDSNTCNFTIFNLNSDSRNKINIDEAKIYLYAGYLNDTGDELIFTGDINLISSVIERPNIITKIEAKDGQKKMDDVKLSVSFKEGVSVAQVVQKAIDKLGLPIKTKALLDPLKKIKFNNGHAFMGTAKTLLDILFAGVNMDWSIQNGEIKFYNSNSTDNSFAIELNSNTLIGSPERIKIKKSKKDSSPEVNGWRIITLLSPKVEPGGSIIVTSKEIPERSTFKILNVEHSGDSFEGEFLTKIEVIQV